MTAPRLSKSKYLSGLQCPKRLYLEIHSPELAGEIDEGTQARFDVGTEVGVLARGCYPGGVLVDAEHFNITQGVQQTRELLADPRVPAIYEAFVQFDNVLVRADILERVRGTRWRLIEVKSTSQVKGEHLDDLAIQSYVLTGASLRLDAALLMHINTGYVYPGGDLDLRQLYVCQDLTREVAGLQPQIPGRLAEMWRVLSGSVPPRIEPDDHCQDPYECPFWEHCTEAKPARWVLYLPGSRRAFQELTALGVQTIDEIRPGFPLTEVQRRVKDNVEWIGPGLRTALEGIRHPVHHLDFETLGSAIPLYPNTRAYQAIPFQWSNHIETRDGAVRHEEYLCGGRQDPREELAVALLKSLGKTGSICKYTNYEQGILTGLAEVLPALRRDLGRVMDRLWDLHPIIKAHYYHPGFAGSYSIKSVLPVIVPRLAYDDLEIQEGTVASVQFYRMVFETVDDPERARIRAALLAYCARDTLAMVELRRALRLKAQG